MPASSSRLEPRPKAASRSTRCSHSAPCSCQAEGGLPRVAELAPAAGHALDELDGAAARRRRRRAAAPGGVVSWSRVGSLAVGGARVVARRAPASDGRVQVRSVTAVAHPVAQQGRRRRRRTSRGGTGSPHSGPFSTAATKRSPCVGPGDHGRDGREGAVGLERPLLHRIRVHEVEPLVLDAGEQPRARRRPSTVDQPMCGTTWPAAARPVPGHSPSPSSAGDARLGRPVEQHLHADADAEHRPAAGEPQVDQPGPPAARSPRMQAWKLPTPGTNRPSAASTAAAVGGQLDLGADALERAHGRADVAAAVVEDDHAGGASRPPPARPAGGPPRPPPRRTARPLLAGLDHRRPGRPAASARPASRSRARAAPGRAAGRPTTPAACVAGRTAQQRQHAAVAGAAGAGRGGAGRRDGPAGRRGPAARRRRRGSHTSHRCTARQPGRVHRHDRAAVDGEEAQADRSRRGHRPAASTATASS